MKYLILPLLTLVLSCEPMKIEDPKVVSVVVVFADGNKDTLIVDDGFYLYQKNLRSNDRVIAYDVKYVKELKNKKEQ